MKKFNPLSMAITIPLILVGCASKPTNPTGDFVGTTIGNDQANHEEISFAVGTRYQVKTGDTVSGIAKKFNMDWRELSKFNHLDSKHTIYAGQWLNIPASAQIAAPSQPLVSVVRTASEVVQTPAPAVQVETTINQPPQPTPQPLPVVEPPTLTIQNTPPVLVVSDVLASTPMLTPTPTPEPAFAPVAIPAPVVVSTPTPPTSKPIPQVMPALGLGFNGSANNALAPSPVPIPTPTAQAQQTPNFIYPVGQDNLVVKGFGVPIPNGKTEGIFFVGNVGDAIVASETGTVVYANAHPTATNRPMVVIDHNNGYVSTYFDVGTILVKVGDSVRRGDRLGGMTPQTKSGKALFEFRIAQSGRYIDPMGIIKWTVPSGL